MFRFNDPFWLLLILLLPIIVWYRKREVFYPVMAFSSTHRIAFLKRTIALKLMPFLPVLKYAVLGLLMIAMARPQFGTKHTEVLSEGINIILAIDLSQSMAAIDFKKRGGAIDRLEAVKGVVKAFCRERKGDRIGMVVFGSNAYTQLPLTRDYSAITYVLDRLKIGAAGENTAIGDAIGISLKRLEDVESKSNVIILLTDGSSNSGTLAPLDVAEVAFEKKVKIYTIGVGGKGRAPFIFRGQRVMLPVDFDEATLIDIARRTDGLYFKAENLEGLKKVYQTIDEMEKSTVRVKSYSEFNELYPYFLIPAVLLMILWITLINTRFLRIP